MENSKAGLSPLTCSERHSLKEIYEEFFRLVFFITCDFFRPVEAEDIVHDFFIKRVVSALRKGKDTELKNKAYIAKMTTNYCLSRIKPMKYKKMSEAISIDDLSDTLSQTRGDEVDQKIDLVTLLSFLGKKERKVIHLYLKGYNGKEIEKITGLSNASKKRIEIVIKLAKLMKNK